MSTEHHAAPPAVETDDEVTAEGSVDGDSRCRRGGDHSWLPKLGEGSVDQSDKVREIACGDGVVREVAANNPGDETGGDRLTFFHRFAPPFPFV